MAPDPSLAAQVPVDSSRKTRHSSLFRPPAFISGILEVMHAGSTTRMVIGLFAALCIAYAQSSFAVQHVDDFTLLDQNGKPHELHHQPDKKVLVLMVQGNGCPITRAAWSALKEIRARFAARGVGFMMLNPNLQDDRASIRAEAREFGYDIPILIDGTQAVGEALGVTRTAEVFVIETKTWNVVYRGPVDDRLTYERQRATAREEYLADALNDVLAGKPVAVARRDSAGCIVNFPNRDEPAVFPQGTADVPPGGIQDSAHGHRH